MPPLIMLLAIPSLKLSHARYLKYTSLITLLSLILSTNTSFNHYYDLMNPPRPPSIHPSIHKTCYRRPIPLDQYPPFLHKGRTVMLGRPRLGEPSSGGPGLDSLLFLVWFPPFSKAEELPFSRIFGIIFIVLVDFLGLGGGGVGNLPASSSSGKHSGVMNSRSRSRLTTSSSKSSILSTDSSGCS